MRFHHVQLFVSAMKPMHEYKALEARLNKLAGMGHFDPFSGGMRFLEVHAHQARVQEGARVWETISCQGAPAFVSAGQDLVEQLIVGLGWRITAEVRGPSTARASLCLSHYRRCCAARSAGVAIRGRLRAAGLPWIMRLLRVGAPASGTARAR